MDFMDSFFSYEIPVTIVPSLINNSASYISDVHIFVGLILSVLSLCHLFANPVLLIVFL